MKIKELWIAQFKNDKKFDKKMKEAQQKLVNATPNFESTKHAYREAGVFCGSLEQMEVVAMCKKEKIIQWLKIPYCE